MEFEKLYEKALSFCAEREWAQFHNPKDLAISISLESAELLECFQWSGDDLVVPDRREQMIDELADVFNYCLIMASVLDVDILEAVNEKIDKNAEKYPVEMARASSKKYTELQK